MNISIEHVTKKIKDATVLKDICLEMKGGTVYGKNCYQTISKWADAEYIEPEKIDWSKMPVDTAIFVSDDNMNWVVRHFAKYENNMIYAWADGKTSYTADKTVSWAYAKL